MWRLLFFLALSVAVLDPYLLYRLGAAYGFWAVLALLFLPGILFGRLARAQGLRCYAKLQEDVARGASLAPKISEGVVVLAARFLLVYPGPITSVLGCVLLVPGVRRAMARLFLRGCNGRLPASLSGRFGAGSGGPNGFFRVVSFGGAGAPPGGGGGDGRGLKVAEGRDLTEKPSQAGEFAPPKPENQKAS